MGTPETEGYEPQPGDSTSELPAVFMIRPYEGRIPLDTKPLLQLIAGAYHDGIRYLSIGRVPIQPLYRDFFVKTTRRWICQQPATLRDPIHFSVIGETSQEVRLLLGVKGYEKDEERGNAAIHAVEQRFEEDYLHHDLASYVEDTYERTERKLSFQQYLGAYPLRVDWVARHYPKSLARLLQTFSLQLDKRTANGSTRIFSGEVQPLVRGQPLPSWNGGTPQPDETDVNDR
jgi:hypothetical protein